MSTLHIHVVPGQEIRGSRTMIFIICSFVDCTRSVKIAHIWFRICKPTQYGVCTEGSARMNFWISWTIWRNSSRCLWCRFSTKPRDHLALWISGACWSACSSKKRSEVRCPRLQQKDKVVGVLWIWDQLSWGEMVRYAIAKLKRVPHIWWQWQHVMYVRSSREKSLPWWRWRNHYVFDVDRWITQ